METTKVWKVEEIAHLLQTNDKMVIRSLMKLYGFQTDEEQDLGETTDYNGVGFNGADAPILSSIAENYLKWNRLTPKQLALVRKKMMKYAKQLTKIANGKQG